MSDLETYLNRCYQLIFHNEKRSGKEQDEELCRCIRLVKQSEQK